MTDCSANAGPPIVLCYTDASFQLLGDPATGSVASPPNYQWTGPAGFSFSSITALQPTITPQSPATQFTPGTYTFTLCVDCNQGTSCNDVTVIIGDDPTEPGALTVQYSCNGATVTGTSPDSDEIVDWNWQQPYNPLFNQTGPDDEETIDFVLNAVNSGDCGPYTITYTIFNGGCPSQSVSTVLNIESLPAADANANGGNTRSINCTSTFTEQGSWLGCGNATGTWSLVNQPGGATSTFTTSNGGRNISAAGLTVDGQYEYLYTVTPDIAGGSLCQPSTSTLFINRACVQGCPRFDLGPNLTGRFCGDFPTPVTVCANLVPVGSPITYNWIVEIGGGVGGATIAPVAGHPECQEITFPTGPNAPTFIRIRVNTVGDTCGTDYRYYSFFRLDNPTLTTDTIGIGCITGVYGVNTRDYFDGTIYSDTYQLTVDAVPTGSAVSTGNLGGSTVPTDVNGIYELTIYVSTTDDSTGQTCSDTFDLVIARYPDVEQPNAGAPQAICSDIALLNGNVPGQAGTTVTWEILPGSPSGAVLNDPNIADPTVSGLDVTQNGAVYTFVYTFSLAPDGCEKTDTVTVTIDCPRDPCDTLDIQAAFTHNAPTSSTTVTFTDVSTLAPGFNMSYITWFFYDDQGNLLPGITPNPDLGLPGETNNVTFPGPGTYVVCLQASAYLPGDPYNLCCHDLICDTIVISDTCDIHHAAFTTTMNGATATFTDVSTHGDVTKFDFDGDGIYDDIGNGVGYSVSHTYPGPGTYVVCMISIWNYSATQCCHDTICDTIVIDICDPHVADFSHTLNGNTATFTDNSTIGNVTKWDFDGDGIYDDITAGVGTTTSHTYPGPGTYTVCMISIWEIDKNTCCHDTICKRITIRGCTPQIVKNMRCEVRSDGQFSQTVLAWDAVPGASGYTLYVLDPPQPSRCCPAVKNPTGMSYQVSGTSFPVSSIRRRCFIWIVIANCDPAQPYAIPHPDFWTCYDSRECRWVKTSEPQLAVATVGKRLSIEELYGDDLLTLSPVPSHNWVNLEGPVVQEGAVVNVMNTMGQVVQKYTLTENDKATVRFNLPPGMYLLQVNGTLTAQPVTRPFIVK